MYILGTKWQRKFQWICFDIYSSYHDWKCNYSVSFPWAYITSFSFTFGDVFFSVPTHLSTIALIISQLQLQLYICPIFHLPQIVWIYIYLLLRHLFCQVFFLRKARFYVDSITHYCALIKSTTVDFLFFFKKSTRFIFRLNIHLRCQ